MGHNEEVILARMEARIGTGRPSQGHPYGMGDAARNIIDVLENLIEK